MPLFLVDGSAVTLWGPMQWAEEIDNKDKDEPEFINAHYIRHLQPEGRFVVIVRNPTERLTNVALYSRIYPSKCLLIYDAVVAAFGDINDIICHSIPQVIFALSLFPS